MTTFEERLVNELRAESELVPRTDPAPLPRPAPRWPRFLATAAVALAVIAGSWLLFNQPPAPLASSVTVISVSGDADDEVVDLWVDWWEAWTEVRQNATVFPEQEDGDITSPKGEFNPRPLDRLAADRAARNAAASMIFTTDPAGGYVGVGEPTEVRLAPHVEVHDGRATIEDCVYLDPIPWSMLRHSGSTAGTAQFTAEMELTPDGWQVSSFDPEPLGEQSTNEPCEPGEN